MARRPSLSMNDLVRKDKEKNYQQFLHETEEFPCLFNLEKCRLDIGGRKYTGNILCEKVPENKLKSLLEDLKSDDEVSECDELVWKENLLTYVYTELKDYGNALKINTQIQNQYGINNLVALVNSAFLFFKMDKFKEANGKLDDLRNLKFQQKFTDLKIDAICELGYAFRKLAGAKNLQLSISFLEFVLLFRPKDEQVQLMLGIAYRRCAHFNIYSADPQNINRQEVGLKAAKILSTLGTTSTNTSFQAAALIELAYLKYEDDTCDKHRCNEKHRILSQTEWVSIVGKKTWKQLREEALEVCNYDPSEKVLKIAGQLYRYDHDDESLKKSERFLLNAIAKRPSNRAHHHLGLTYKKMAANYEHRNDINQQQFGNAQNDSSTGYSYKPNRFRHNTNRGNYRHKFAGRQERTMHRGTFSYNARSRYTTNGLHTNQRGFRNRPEHFNHHRIFENNTEDASGCRLNVLPEPHMNKSPEKIEKHLKYIAKVPDKFKSFSKDNPYTCKAIDHLKQASELSCYQNRSAVYDYASFLVTAEDYEKAKETCNHLIKECTSTDTTNDPLRLVNAYNLYGICCAKEAEAETCQMNKEQLEKESEEKLIQAVRLASLLAATVPELEMCATDLWKAFTTLQRKFKFEGQKDSREKLFSLCEFISDHSCLMAVDDVLSQDRSELEKIEVIEQCLQRYLNLKEFDSAFLFRDLIILLPGVKAKLSNSKVYKQLMLEVAEGKLDETYLRNTVEYRPDLAWKQLFDDELISAGNSKKWDVVIVSDFDADYELKQGLMNDISIFLKTILQKIFGLNVVHTHEEVRAGQEQLEESLQIISRSHVSIFVLTEPYVDSLSLESELVALKISGNQDSAPRSTPTRNEGTSEGAMAASQQQNENSVSKMYERIINASICNSLNEVGATRMMFIVPHSLKLKDLPQAVRGLTTVLSQSEIETLTAVGDLPTVVPSLSEIETLTAVGGLPTVVPSQSEIETLTAVGGLPTVVPSQSEIDILTAAASVNDREQCLNLMKKVFRAVLGHCPA